MTDIREVASYATTFDAEVAIAHLQSEGIDAFLATDDAGGTIPSLTGLSGGARVLVRSEDVDRAGAALVGLRDRDGGGETG